MKKRFRRPNGFLRFLGTAGQFLAKLMVSIMLFAGMIGGHVGGSLYFAGALQDTLPMMVVGWLAIPLTTTLFLFYGLGIIQNWMKPYMDQAPKKKTIIIAVCLTLVTSGLVAFASMGAADDGLMLGLFFSCVLAIVVLAHLAQTEFAAKFRKVG